VKFEVLTAAKMSIVVFWDLTVCSLVRGYHKTTRRHNQEDGNQHFGQVFRKNQLPKLNYTRSQITYAVEMTINGKWSRELELGI
jgi:hypothetical protein